MAEMLGPMPAGGWPLRLAIFTLASGKFEAIAIQSEELERKGFDITVPRRILWLHLADRAARAEISVFWRAPRSQFIVKGTSSLLRDAAPNFDNDTLTTQDGLIFRGVGMLDKKNEFAPIERGATRRRFPEADVRRFLEEYVAAWRRGDAPEPDQRRCLAAAKDELRSPDLSRTPFIKLYNNIIPLELVRRGRRGKSPK